MIVKCEVTGCAFNTDDGKCSLDDIDISAIGRCYNMTIVNNCSRCSYRARGENGYSEEDMKCVTCTSMYSNFKQKRMWRITNGTIRSREHPSN